jgi:ketosteroid isomerase-like protein
VVAGDFDELYERFVAPDMELRLPVGYPDLERSTGYEGMRAMFRMFEQVWDEWRYETESYATAGDTTVVLTILVARGRGSGVEIKTPVAHVWQLRDGLVASVEVQPDRPAALARTGLDEGDLKPFPNAE